MVEYKAVFTGKGYSNVGEMSYNWLSYEVVGNSVCSMWKSGFSFPYAVNRVIHDEIASYAHFHDAVL